MATASTTSPSKKQSQANPRRSKKLSVEKTMVLVSLVFVAGLVMYGITPPDTPMRSIGMTTFIVTTMWVVWRFGQ